MKKTILLIVALTAAACLAGCSSDRPGDIAEPQTRQGAVPQSDGLPLYDLNLKAEQLDFKPYNTLFVIRSMSEMLSHMKHFKVSSIPSVDFTKNTVLLVGGLSSRGVSTVERSLKQKLTGGYQLDLNVHLNLKTYMCEWCVCVVAPLIPPGANVSLTIRSTNDF